MPWYDNIPGSQTRQTFQTLVVDLTNFHKHFAKEKNHSDFNSIADQLLKFKNDVIFADTKPGTEVVGGSLGVITQLLANIDHRKQGAQNEQEFRAQFTKINQDITKLSLNITSDLKHKSEGVAEVKIQHAANPPFAEDVLENLINGLRLVPEHSSIMNFVRATAYHNPKKMIGSAGLLTFAFGAGLQSLIDSQCGSLKILLPIVCGVSGLGLAGLSSAQTFFSRRPAEAKEGYLPLSDGEKDLEGGLRPL